MFFILFTFWTRNRLHMIKSLAWIVFLSIVACNECNYVAKRCLSFGMIQFLILSKYWSSWALSWFHWKDELPLMSAWFESVSFEAEMKIKGRNLMMETVPFPGINANLCIFGAHNSRLIIMIRVLTQFQAQRFSVKFIFHLKEFLNWLVWILRIDGATDAIQLKIWNYRVITAHPL